MEEEYDLLEIYYAGYKLIQQALHFHEDKPYDVIKIETSDGKTVSVYFDISEFFGKEF